jgi:hypothetical protein
MIAFVFYDSVRSVSVRIMEGEAVVSLREQEALW